MIIDALDDSITIKERVDKHAEFREKCFEYVEKWFNSDKVQKETWYVRTVYFFEHKWDNGFSTSMGSINITKIASLDAKDELRAYQEYVYNTLNDRQEKYNVEIVF